MQGPCRPRTISNLRSTLAICRPAKIFGISQQDDFFKKRLVYYYNKDRVGPDSPFALLSPVLCSEIPFEKGFFWKVPFLPLEIPHLVFVALFCARNSPFAKNILALFPCSGDPKCPAPPCKDISD